ncbi:hypothetical protein [Caenimonas aquaedulcis]|uniref:Uncharacterized protein n=1 Tax=Caenimonas aquaedulcis TaxID=2793270 RepID=A0A931H483_9BURK|nr:hypothetical protein [Caenimonas aquaedulcis]MBG9388271.1 hypothetical protein [Caenimonas aquaedulcis]
MHTFLIRSVLVAASLLAPITARSQWADPAAAVAAAREDAVRRAGIPEGELQVLSVERVTWPDASLGCPREGVLYTQALVKGWRVRLQSAAGELDYHLGERGAPLPCPPGRSRAPLPASSN